MPIRGCQGWGWAPAAAVLLQAWPAEQFCIEAPDVLPQWQGTMAPEEPAWSLIWVLWSVWYHRKHDGNCLLPPALQEVTWLGSPGGHSVKMVYLNFLYPAAAREPSSWLLLAHWQGTALWAPVPRSMGKGVKSLMLPCCPHRISWVGGLGVFLTFSSWWTFFLWCFSHLWLLSRSNTSSWEDSWSCPWHLLCLGWTTAVT